MYHTLPVIIPPLLFLLLFFGQFLFTNSGAASFLSILCAANNIIAELNFRRRNLVEFKRKFISSQSLSQQWVQNSCSHTLEMHKHREDKNYEESRHCTHIAQNCSNIRVKKCKKQWNENHCHIEDEIDKAGYLLVSEE